MPYPFDSTRGPINRGDVTTEYQKLFERLKGERYIPEGVDVPTSVPGTTPQGHWRSLPAISVPVRDIPGEIDVTYKASLSNLTDQRLVAALRQAVQETGIPVFVTSISGGKHTNNSRHYRGNAMDIWPKSGLMSDADRLDAWFRSHGFRNDVEAAGEWAVLWRMDDHYDHLHISSPDN